MKTLNLAYPEKSEIEYKITTFPDGEPHIVLTSLNVKEELLVKCRIRNPNELYILLQVLEILNRNGIYPRVQIGYLMSMRMDRVMDYNRPYSLKIVCDLLNNYNVRYEIYSPHSNKYSALLHKRDSWWFLNEPELLINCEGLIVYADDSAVNHFSIITNPFIVIHKKRNIDTGKIVIKDFSEDDKKKLDTTKAITIADDLVDGGATICNIIEKVREYLNTTIPINIVVRHAVNKEGLAKLLFKYPNIDVYTTNSYEDWDKVFPSVPNLHVTNIF